MTPEEMWELYKKEAPKAAGYEAWAFGGDGNAADELSDLVLADTKTATASAYDLYLAEDSPLPQAGDLSVILNGMGQAVCIIETDTVVTVPYALVSADHAYREGERDKSLASWRSIHKSFFTKELQSINRPFSEDMLVVCERFHVVFPKKD